MIKVIARWFDQISLSFLTSKASHYLTHSRRAGLVETSGRKAEGLQVESLDGQTSLPLPPLIECNEILNDRSEIPTPDAARHHPHLSSVAAHIPELDPNAEILILLDRDIVRFHKVWQQVSGPPDTPFAQKMDLGWVLVGMCV